MTNFKRETALEFQLGIDILLRFCVYKARRTGQLLDCLELYLLRVQFTAKEDQMYCFVKLNSGSRTALEFQGRFGLFYNFVFTSIAGSLDREIYGEKKGIFLLHRRVKQNKIM